MEAIELTNSAARYEISVWKDDHRSSLLRRPWELLVSSRESSASIYQGPEYFDYLQDSERDCRFAVLTAQNRQTHAIVGIVPIKLSTYRLQFRFRAHTFASIRLESIGILGGEPMIPEDPCAFDQLFLSFAQNYPESQVIHMDAVPSSSYLWNHLQTSRTIRRLYRPLIAEGFREWHSIPLPPSIEEYNKRLPRKKRYNLMRQERMLQSHCGNPLQLTTIDKEKDLQYLYDAIERLPTQEKYGPHGFVYRKEDYVYLSRHNLLHCYVLMSGERHIGLVLGIKAGKTLKIDRLVHDTSLERFSPGTTLWQLVLQDLIGSDSFTSVDFGYGLPAYRFRTTNVIENKGRILLFRRSIANQCLIAAHSCYSSVIHFARSRLGHRSPPGVPPRPGVTEE